MPIDISPEIKTAIPAPKKRLAVKGSAPGTLKSKTPPKMATISVPPTRRTSGTRFFDEFISAPEDSCESTDDSNSDPGGGPYGCGG
jgi:hypothetical protein